MDTLDPELREQLKQPRKQVDLVIRVRSGMGDRTPDFEALGCTIRRRFRLTRSYSISCTGTKAIKLSHLDWVERIELDRSVKALEAPPAGPAKR